MNTEQKNRANAQKFLLEEFGGLLLMETHNVQAEILLDSRAANYVRIAELYVEGSGSLPEASRGRLLVLGHLLLLDIAESFADNNRYGLRFPLGSSDILNKHVSLSVVEDECGVVFARSMLRLALNQLTHLTPELRALKKAFNKAKPSGRPPDNERSLRALNECGRLRSVAVVAAKELIEIHSKLPTRDAVALHLVNGALGDFEFDFGYLRENLKAAWWSGGL